MCTWPSAFPTDVAADHVADDLRRAVAAAQLPWFARNVVIKVLIVARLGRLTKLRGHRQPTLPY